MKRVRVVGLLPRQARAIEQHTGIEIDLVEAGSLRRLRHGTDPTIPTIVCAAWINHKDWEMIRKRFDNYRLIPGRGISAIKKAVVEASAA